MHYSQGIDTFGVHFKILKIQLVCLRGTQGEQQEKMLGFLGNKL